MNVRVHEHTNYEPMKAKNNNTIQTLAYEIYYCETETFKKQWKTSKTSEKKKKKISFRRFFRRTFRRYFRHAFRR